MNNKEWEILDKKAIYEWIKNKSFENIKELEPEQINKIYEIIKIMKTLNNIEREEKRYEIRNICK